VVGAGAAGVEILLAIQFRLQVLLGQHQRETEELEFHLISNTDRDEVLWVTGASAPTWPRESGFDVDDSGFIRVNESLQSTSHADIFAAGDIVHMINHPRPKAGVFAVRQGKPLSDNLRRTLLNHPLKAFAPQKTLLALVSTGDKYAIASKGRWHFEGEKLWAWKDRIDRRWMLKYSDLPEMSAPEKLRLNHGLADQQALEEISAMAMRCGGCGAKIGANVLSRTISELKPVPRNDILIGLHQSDDAAVVEVPPGKVMVHTVDYFRSFIDDPYIFAQIAANHCLSDIFAMGAEAQSALAIVTLPFGIEVKVEDTLRQLMSGAMLVLNDANAALVGGHTSEGAEMALGFSVNGIADRQKIMRKAGMQAGDVLILTKALGTGTLFAADMQQKATGRWIEAALRSMLQSNRLAAEHLYAHGATACTDITGFGLLGHMVEMIRPSGVDVEVDLPALPLIDGALETVQMGILSSLQPANLHSQSAIRNIQEAETSALFPLVFDPQTSGGLLASIPAEKADSCLLALHNAGYAQAAIIGRVKVKSDKLETVTLLS